LIFIYLNFFIQKIILNQPKSDENKIFAAISALPPAYFKA
jgi:hypothetical protein